MHYYWIKFRWHKIVIENELEGEEHSIRMRSAAGLNNDFKLTHIFRSRDAAQIDMRIDLESFIFDLIIDCDSGMSEWEWEINEI